MTPVLPVHVCGLIGCMALGWGCATEKAAPRPHTVTSNGPSDPLTLRTRVDHLVFVDKENACDCTKKRVDAAWNAVHAVWGADRSSPERVHADTQAERLEALRQKRPALALPAIYLLDAHGEVVTLLQGEVSEDELRQAIR